MGLLHDVQLKDTKYIPLIAEDTPPPIWLNKEVAGPVPAGVEEVLLRPDPVGTYLEQLGITYPTLRRPASTR